MEKKKYRLLVIGPVNRHIETFVNRVIESTSAIHLISNGTMELPERVSITSTSFSLRKFSNFLSTVRQIRQTIQEFKPDVIHVHEINSVALFAILGNKKCNVPMVITAWGSDILINPEKSLILRQMVKYILRKGNAFTSDSIFMAEKMKQLVPEKELDVVVCNFGIEETDIAINKEKIIFSNRMHNPLYNIDVVIRQFSLFLSNSTDKDWRLIVAGRGSQTDELKLLVNDLKLNEQVVFVGFLTSDQNNTYYAKASYFISIPKSDATAVSLLEAMYYKCIPIVSDLPANREWIDDGKTGLIVKDISTDFISEAIRLGMKDAGEFNRSKIKSEATIEVSSDKFTQLHRKVMRK